MKNAYEQFKSEPKVIEFCKLHVFYNFVKNNYRVKVCEDAIRDYLKPLVVPLQCLETFKEAWDVTVSEIRSKPGTFPKD